MKKIIIFFNLTLILTNAYTQYTTIVNETFSSTLNGWTIKNSSSATWNRDTNYYVSSPSSYKGEVPSSSNVGDSIVLTSPVFDLSQYPYVFLRFNHICKVSQTDICQISIKEYYSGSQWHVIPSNCYLGTSKNYSKDKKFNDVSYTDWRSDSLWLQPSNTWWKTESFDISSEASFAPIQIKFTIIKGTSTGSEFAAGWFIDNFELLASMNEIRTPLVEFLPPLVIDTLHHTGPFTINAKVATRTNMPINHPKLEVIYTYGQTISHDTLLMTNIAGDSIWQAIIPQKLFNTHIKYSINASDTGGNKSFATNEFYLKRIGIGDSNSVAIKSIDYPKDLVVGGQATPVVVSFSNKGLKALDSCILNWSLNGVLQTAHKWKGHLSDDHSTQDTIGYYFPRQNIYDTIFVWVGMPNGIVDTITNDDTAHVYTYGCITILSGEYIVGPDPNADFMSINTVINALSGCGSSGNVILKLQSDTLVENVNLLNLKNLLGANDTLIITSLSGNAQDAVIKPLNGSAFTIGKSDNIIIKNITIDVSAATSPMSHGVHFVDTCSNIWIDSCIIIAKNVSDTGYDCIHQLNTATSAGSGLLTNLYITNNILTNGYHGIYLFGRAYNKKNSNVNICNNTITVFGMGMRLWGTDFNKINNNYITRNSTTARWCHGIYFQYSFGKELCNNRIYMSGVGGAPSTSWNCGGIVGWSGNGPAGVSATNRLLVANNEIIITAANIYARGIYCSSGPNHTDFMHNSVLMLGNYGSSSDAPMCFDIVNGVGAAYKANIFNNNFINLSGTSTGTKNYAIRLPASNITFIRDYNNYYSIGQYPVATRSAGYPNIQAWISAFYLDSNSMNVLPDSITATSTDLRVEESQILCPALTQVPFDINLNQRIVTTNMGCHHTNIPDAYDAGIAELSFSRNFADSVYPTVLVSVINMGSQILDSVEIHWSVNGIAQPTYMWHGSLGRGQKSANFNIGNFMVRRGINEIVVYTSSPNGQLIDGNHNNDTASYKEFACSMPLVGTYTVGSSQADFIDEKEMMQAVNNCGVGGTVVFEFLSGTYGDLSFSNYPLPSVSTDSITITSAAGHPDSVIFKSSDMAALSIGNIAHFIFSNVTFDATANGYHAVKFTNPMNNIKFYGCNIYGNPTAITTDYTGIYYAGLSGNINDITFIKNKITGGYYNLYFNNPGANRIILDSNELTNAAGAGVYCSGSTYFSSISNNLIESRLNTTANYYGVHLYSRGNIDTMVCNKIHVTTTATAYGLNMYMQLNYSLGVPAFVVNNEIILNGATCYGINGNTTGSSGAVYAQVDYLNNSIYVKGNNVYGIYLNAYSGTNDGKIYKATFKYNNIFASSQSGGAAYAYYVVGTTATPYYNFDYNNYYSTGTNLVYINNTNCVSIADIIATGTGKDSNSININPMYPANPVNLSPSAVMRSPLVSYIPYDIVHELRTSSNNSMGCYAKFFSFDVGLDTFFMPAPISIIGNQTNVVVKLLNYGIDTLQNATVQWTLNGVLQTPFNVTNLALGQYEDTVLTVGSFIPSQSGNINLKAWAECVGDGNAFNDTINMSTYACDSMYTGSYTIGGNNRDFKTINDAIMALSNCGVAGPVILLIDSGTYAPVNISKTFSGANDTNIVSFTSASGNANDVAIESFSTTMTLENAGYLNFNHLTINAKNGSIPTAIAIISSANNIEISNCIIKANIIRLDTNKYHRGVIISENITKNINNLKISHNIIDGGLANIYLQTGNNLTYGKDIIINENIMTNAYSTGMNIVYTDIASIAYNQISSQANSTANFTGISLNQCNVYLNANKIRALSSTLQRFTGIELSYINQNASKNGLLSNNEIIASATTENNYGIYLNQHSYINIIHNSIFLNSANAKCLYVTTATNNMLLKNNNFISEATAYPIYFSLLAYSQSSTMDYNNYYSGGNYIGYAGSRVADISTWKSLTMNDAHSVSILPSFVNINTDLSLNNSNNNGLACLIDSNVLTDINDSLRILYTYMGAYTASVFAGNDLEMVSIIEPINTPENICYQNYSAIKVVISNQGAYLIDFATNNLKLCAQVTGAINFQLDTLITSGSIDIFQNDTFEITNMLPVSKNGTYHIKVWLENIIDQINSNDTITVDYLVDLLTLPYNENFNVLPTEFTFKQLSGNLGWSVQQGAGSNPTINPTNGTGRLTFASELGAIASARLHPINLLGSQKPKLEFWYAHDNNNSSKDDKLFVRISTDGGTTFQNLDEIKRYNDTCTTPIFIHYTFDLSYYAMYSCVIIDFYGQSFGGGNQNIDSIAITSQEDLMVDLDIAEESELIACELDNIPIIIKIINKTSQFFDLQKYPTNINVKINGAVDTTFQLPLTNGIIAGDTTILYTLSYFNFSTNGTYNILAYIDAVDNNSLNDTVRLMRNIQVDADLFAMDTIYSKTIGDTIYPTIYIANNGNIPINGFTANIKINNTLTVSEYVDTLLAINDTLIYTFKNPYLVPTVTETQPFYQLKIDIVLTCDGDMSNNSYSQYYTVDIPSYVDLSISRINYPIADSCETGLNEVFASITIINNGATSSQDGTLQIEIDSAGIIIHTFVEAIDDIIPNNTILHTCTQSYIVPNFNGNYTVKFTIECTEDIDMSNNKLSVITCAKENLNINEKRVKLWLLGQNIPNPAQTFTEIPYSIPQDGTINVKIVSVSGQVLYQKEMKSVQGNHTLLVDIDFLANGIYYYSMEYEGRTIVKKMTIQK